MLPDPGKLIIPIAGDLVAYDLTRQDSSRTNVRYTEQAAVETLMRSRCRRLLLCTLQSPVFAEVRSSLKTLNA